MFFHEDNRRKLFEISTGAFKVCKALIAKAGCIVGDHYHQKKDERFMLVSGMAHQVIIGGETFTEVPAPFEWTVTRGTYHLFDLAEGSILVGTATEEFDYGDEIKGRP